MKTQWKKDLIFLSCIAIFICCLVTTTNGDQFSRVFQLVKSKKRVGGGSHQNDRKAFRVERVHSLMECLMVGESRLHYFVQVTKTTGDSYHKYECKLFQGMVEEFEFLSDSESGIYEPSKKALLCQDYQDIKDNKNSSRVYNGFVGNSQFNFYCDMEREGGGWTTIQRRFDGSVDFNRNWADYKKGFGDSAGEYWLGLDNIHAITKTFENVMVRIEASTFEGERAVMIFEGFKVDSEVNLYKLTCGWIVEDPLSLAISWLYVNGMAFSTKDADNDLNPNGNCASSPSGGGWNKNCNNFKFNGRYPEQGDDDSKLLRWTRWKENTGLKKSSISIKIKHY